MEKSVYEVPIISEKNKTTDMWEYSLIFIWTAFRGGGRTFCANTFALECSDDVDFVASVLSYSVFNIFNKSYSEEMDDKEPSS